MSQTNHPRAAEIAELWRAGLRVSEIAERLGMLRGAIAGFSTRNRDLCPVRDPTKDRRSGKTPSMGLKLNLASRLAHYPKVPRVPKPMEHPWPTYVRTVSTGTKVDGLPNSVVVTLRQTSIEARPL